MKHGEPGDTVARGLFQADRFGNLPGEIALDTSVLGEDTLVGEFTAVNGAGDLVANLEGGLEVFSDLDNGSGVVATNGSSGCSDAWNDDVLPVGGVLWSITVLWSEADRDTHLRNVLDLDENLVLLESRHWDLSDRSRFGLESDGHWSEAAHHLHRRSRRERAWSWGSRQTFW